MGILKDRRLEYERKQMGLALAELLVEGDNITLEHNVGDGTVTINGAAGGESGGLTTNQVKDLVGAMGVDTATIDWTYDGTARTFSFAVKNNSISVAMLSFDPATQAELQAVIDSVTTVSGAAATAQSAADAAQATANTAVTNAAAAAAAAATAQTAANTAQTTANTAVTNAATAQTAADAANTTLLPANLVNLLSTSGAVTIDVNAGKVRFTVPVGLTQEQVEDFAAAMFPDDSMWDFTYTDNGSGAGTIALVPKDGTISAAKLNFDVATQSELDAVSGAIPSTEAIQDIIGGLFGDTTSVDVTYNDAGNAESIAVNDEYVQDVVGAMLSDTSVIDVTYNDAGNVESLTIANGSITTAMLAFDVATQAELDVVAARMSITRLAADVTNLTTTPADTINSGTLQPGTYKFTVDGTWSSSSTSAGLRVCFHFDGTASAINYQAFIGTSSTAIRCESTTTDAATLGGATSATANSPYPFQLRGTIVVTAAGVLHFQHAGSSAVTLKVLVGTELTTVKV